MRAFALLLAMAGVAVAGGADLKVTKIQVGKTYSIEGNCWGKILQVVDDDNMLVGIDNGGAEPGGKPRYSITVWCKFPAKDKTDGTTGFLTEILGVKSVSVPSTTRYKTVTGGTRTVYVFAPVK